jgi:hypothetical protein
MSLSDEATEKNLLIQLADRDLISQETLLQRFKEIPQIEKIRIQREVEDRNNNVIPNKASPYHNPQHENDLEKIGLQTGKLLPKDVGLKSSVPTDILLQPKGSPFGSGGSPSSPKAPNPNGRPPLSKDSGPRKQRVANPKSTPGVAELLVWTEAAWDNISEVLNDAVLNCNKKKNLRQLKNTLVAYNLLEKDDTNRSNNRVTMKKLVGLVEDVFDTEVLAKNRMQNTVFARKAAAYVLKKHTSLSLKEIAPYIGVKDHTTVLYNVSTARDLMATEDWYKNKIDEIENEINKFNTFVQN